MSSFSAYIKKQKGAQRARFFGEVREVSNTYFRFNRVIDDDNVIILTNNLRMINGSYALIVGNNAAIFLKDWQVVPVRIDRGTENTFVVKLNRNWVRPYVWTNGTEFDVWMDGIQDFDDFLAVARKQDEIDTPVAIGHGN